MSEASSSVLGPRSVVGSNRRKVDATAKVTGETRFADDLALPRMLWCKLLRSREPHARIVRIDTSRAERHPGVLAAMTGRDLPIPFGILPVSQDEHALCPDRVRFVGDPVAAVAALDEDVAAEACDLIDVEYEKLPPIESIEDGLAPADASARIHEYGDVGNVHKHIALEFGHVDAAMATADHVRDDVFSSRGTRISPWSSTRRSRNGFPRER
jgi:CO/xanthine dehydrogenase Mo-binding subunit